MEEASSFPDIEVINTFFTKGSARKSKRLGFKVSAQESEFPMLLRGFDADKSKEPELIKKRSLKENIFSQNSFEENKEEVRFMRSEINQIHFDSLEDDELDDCGTLKSPTLVMFEDTNSIISSVPCPGEDFLKVYNVQVLYSVLAGDEPSEKQLYLALNDNYQEAPEMKKTFFEKIGFENKSKSKQLLESALQGIHEVEGHLAEVKEKNGELKKQLEMLQNERKKTVNDHTMLQSNIYNVLAGLTDEKSSFNMKTKYFDNLINEYSQTCNELIVKSRESNKFYFKRLELVREMEELWKMNIDDLRVSLVEVLEKNRIAEIKVKRNAELLKELKRLENLRSFREEQTEFSLEMLLKAMNFFGESKEHEGFNVKVI